MTSHQQRLFDSEPRWEIDDASQCLVAAVVFPDGPDQTYDYRVPDNLRDEVQCGRRVWAPLGRGNRMRLGYCVRLESGADRPGLKSIQAVADSRTLIAPKLLELTRWMVEHYLCSWGQALQTVLPAAVRQHAGTREVRLARLTAQGRAAVDAKPPIKLPPKQAALLRFFAAEAAPIARAVAKLGCTEAPLKSLVRRGLVEILRRRVLEPIAPEPVAPRETHLTLNPDQQRALDAIRAAMAAAAHQTIVIHGVTGSGKTEVYIQAIDEVIRYGRQAIVLVPEISLTPQTRERFRARFDRVAVLHSHLPDTERHDHWDRIARGEVDVVVGARSAVFAPVPQLGLIILDEEHESSFKQGESPRYHARDVALRRAASQGVPLVLASATPSLESWHRAACGQALLVEMPRRVFDRPMPAVATIDLRDEFQNRRQRGAISRKLHQAIVAALAEGGQVILLLNRRGFATHMQCTACGHVIRCPACELALTFHHHQGLAICHYCDYRQPAPTACPQCDAPGIQYSGLGTQRLEAEVRARFPNATCLRMDTDTMRKPGSHARALAAFRAGQVRILLGTQMIAKGLDFPNVTLVGVINADTALHFPDFRAAERTFQLVTQVAGRTGRGDKGGRVLVQTFSPDHPAIRAAVRHDYAMFARDELPIRQSLGYPPFGSMIRAVIRGERLGAVQAFAEHVGESLRTAVAPTQARVLGPAPAPIAKLRGKHRFHIQLLAADGEALRAAVRQVIAQVTPPDDVSWVADVDPVEML
jgi:primosomal protein N' (replication factor Y)